MIGWDNFEKGYQIISRYIASDYKLIKSKRKSELWVRAIIFKLLNIHIEAWKHYFDMIHRSNSKETKISQLHQNKSHEISVIKEEEKELMNEQLKWFNVGDDELGQINIQATSR